MSTNKIHFREDDIPPTPQVNAVKYDEDEILENVRDILMTDIPEDLARAVVQRVSSKKTSSKRNGVVWEDHRLIPGVKSENEQYPTFYIKIQAYRAENALMGQVLKLDHFGHVHILPKIFPDCPNFRQSDNKFPIFGVGQPSRTSLRRVMSHILAINSSHTKCTRECRLTDGDDFDNNFDAEKSGEREGDHELAPKIKELIMDRSVSLPSLTKPLETIPSATELLSSTQGNFRNIVWVNLRAEPVLFINDLPFAPRDPYSLDINLDYLIGIQKYDLERLEVRLKADVLEHVRTTDGVLDYVHQERTGNVWRRQKTKSSQIATILEAYKSLRLEHYPVLYARIPISDELAPDEKDFDALVDLIIRARKDCAFIFNCQMGRGRTTTGMVIATLIHRSLEPDYDDLCVKKHQGCLRPIQRNKDGGFFSLASCDDLKGVGERDLPRGEWDVIVRLCAVLEDGLETKRQVDQAIDECAHTQNLRECIFDCKVAYDAELEREMNLLQMREAGTAVPNFKIEEQMQDKYSGEVRNSAFYRRRGLNYLERYWWLICFNGYLRFQAPSQFRKSFHEYMSERWNLKKLLRDLDLK
eukprot:GCRY01004549.1.p1 GENE.GCRY01004549.1~~GCRY01004549.1.p1  ORF type:complete len:585 (+),score=160.20 GCRY01004549.1:98-1852(+)